MTEDATIAELVIIYYEKSWSLVGLMEQIVGAAVGVGEGDKLGVETVQELLELQDPGASRKPLGRSFRHGCSSSCRVDGNPAMLMGRPAAA